MIAILILLGLVASVISAGLAATEIKDRSYIGLTCFFVGILAGAIVGLIDPVYGLIAGITVCVVSFLLSLSPFEKGRLMIYQPSLLRGNSALNPAEWLIVAPGLKAFWPSVCTHLATLEIGKIVLSGDDAKVDVRFPEGKGSVKFRFDAELPIDLPDARVDRFKLLERFVKATPSGESFTDSAARSKNIREVCQALARRMLEAAAEKVSAFDADAAQIEAIVRSPKTPGGSDSLLEEFLREVEARVGLPAELVQFVVEDAELGEELQKNMAARAMNDSIRDKAILLLEASNVPPPLQYRLELRKEQAADAALFRAMSPGELNDVSMVPAVIKLQQQVDSMMSVADFERYAAQDKKTPPLKIAADINAYRASHAEALSKLEIAKAEEREYRRQCVAQEKANGDAETAARIPSGTLASEKVSLAKRLLGKLEEYKTLYGQVLQGAVDKTAAGADTSRVSISGLDGIGGAHGLEALRVLSQTKK